ncbi:hypothetical protein HHI36_017088 [Cryptolaemus montrouzieri]|uniref:Uncharacterized protein n=1 Tax=Cryptolaemus montrouzieri TaxID=559131 RepID=A0ABD2NMA4_9CUCU
MLCGIPRGPVLEPILLLQYINVSYIKSAAYIRVYGHHISSMIIRNVKTENSQNITEATKEVNACLSNNRLKEIYDKSEKLYKGSKEPLKSVGYVEIWLDFRLNWCRYIYQTSKNCQNRYSHCEDCPIKVTE